MGKRTNYIFFMKGCLYLTLIVTSFAFEDCDKTKCPGPLSFYENLNCKAIYENADDCCAIKYDCSHLKERSTKKCYTNNNVYEIGEALKKEDANPCDIGCICTEGYMGTALFRCAIVDCFRAYSKPGCYLKNSADRCCPGEEVCPDNPEDRPKCIVNGKTYLDGEYFEVEAEPEKTCTCKEGYEGKNIEPFCFKPRRSYCGAEFRNAYEVNQRCAPVYYNQQSPQTDCSVFYRCQNSNDTLISESKKTEKSGADESEMCTFGHILMQVGDELNQGTDYSSVCVKCKCEVPPTPTCQRLPDNECDVTVHPKFDSL